MSDFISPAAVLRMIAPLLTIRYPSHSTLRRMERADADFPRAIQAGGKRSYSASAVRSYIGRKWGEEYVRPASERDVPKKKKKLARPERAKRRRAARS